MHPSEDWEELIGACLSDCLQAQNPQDLFNALNRLKLAVECQLHYLEAQKLLKK